MKTKIKIMLSFLIALTIAFGSVGAAFATAVDYNETDYICYGELAEGWNNIWEYDWPEKDRIKDLYVYYSFSTPEDGYYLLSYGTPHTDMYAQIYNEYDYIETEFSYYGVRKIYYLKKGEHKLIVDVYDSLVDVNIYAEFLGKKITDIKFDYEQLLDYDLEWYGTEGNYSFDSYANATITFSSGKTYEFSGGVLEGTTASNPIDGKNNVTIEFLNQKIDSTVTVYPASHYVTNAELSNAEYYIENTVESYNHLEKEYYPYGETVTLTLSNGTTQIVEYTPSSTYIEFPNGQYYELVIYYDTDPNLFTPNTPQLKICLGYNCVIREYDINGSKATLAENIKSFINDNKEFFGLIFENIVPMLCSIGDKEAFSNYFEDVYTGFLGICINCFDFFHYYATLSFI